MLEWLFDSFLQVNFILGALGVASALAWWRNRRSIWGYGALLAAFLFGLYVLLHFVHGETASEQIERKVQEIAAGVREKNATKVFQHISDQFSITQGSSSLTKADLRRYAEESFRRPEFKGIVISSFKVESIQDRKARVEFMVKVEGTGGEIDLFHCHADFGLESEKQWRMTSFQLMRGIGAGTEPITLPIN